MKTYFSSGEHSVFLKEDQKEAHSLRHHVRHSPTGFSWGYAGSGPADLARCILIDHFDAHDEAEKGTVRDVDRLYHSFKDEVIAKLRDPWELTSDDILEWLDAHEMPGA